VRTSRRRIEVAAVRTAMTFAVCVAVAACSRHEPPPAQSSSSQVIDKQPFTVTLPGSWNESAASGEDTWSFTRADGKVMLTISGMSDPQRRSGEALEQLVRGLVEMRREVDREVSKGATQLEPVTVAHDREIVVARYMASEPSEARHVATVVMGRPGVVLTFYLETLDLSRGDLEALGRPLFNSVVLK
jgi:hypothetical protein